MCYMHVHNSEDKWAEIYLVCVDPESMQNMMIEDKPRSNSFSTRCSSRLCPMGVLSILLSLVILVLSSILVHKSFSTEPEKQLSLREKYPGYFRYPEEQDAFVKQERRVENVTSFITVPGFNGTTPCSLSSPYIPLTPSRSIDNNACCKSNGTYISPKYWKDIEGVNRTMAVFKDSAGNEAKQYFYTETCQQINGCEYNCQCGQRYQYVTGVYIQEPDQYGTAWFKILGCCKCFNY